MDRFKIKLAYGLDLKFSRPKLGTCRGLVMILVSGGLGHKPIIDLRQAKAQVWIRLKSSPKLARILYFTNISYIYDLDIKLELGPKPKSRCSLPDHKTCDFEKIEIKSIMMCSVRA